MSQNYKFKSLEIAKTNQNKEIQKEDKDEFKVYEIGDTKTIDFVMLDGTRQNFPYSHYLTSWLGTENEERVIKVFFATHLVTIKGICLEEIYNTLIENKLKVAEANDKRYLQPINERKPFIANIKITWKK